MISWSLTARPLRNLLVVLSFLFLGASGFAYAQDSFFAQWQLRASATQALQPKWAVPVVSSYPMLIQVFRSDFTRQISTTHVHTWNLDSSRGLNLIPFARTEVDIFTPPFFEHSNTTPNGFGDFSMSAKYRIAAGNETHGNYLLSAFVVATVPTGSYKNGATDASVNPTLSGGKGFGRFDLIANVGGTLPTGGTAVTGRSVTTNVVAQYHIGKFVWPEIEVNSTAWHGGTKDGKIQTFLTPGVMVSKFQIHPGDTHSRAAVAAGFAFQTAATSYYTYNHSLIFTTRFLF